MAFTFKQFHINDELCGMPVSTDGIILGAWAPLAQAKTVLDIGAGSGLLSLMAAQRCDGKITAIELNKLAYEACVNNIKNSPWSQRVTAIHQNILHIVNSPFSTYEHIICNPPFFANGPQSSLSERAQARHTDSLSFEHLLFCIEKLLDPHGKASLILPMQSISIFTIALKQSALYIAQQQQIISVRGKTAHRYLLLLKKHSTHPSRTQILSPLIIRETNNQYTQEMINLTRDFYLYMP